MMKSQQTMTAQLTQARLHRDAITPPNADAAPQQAERRQHTKVQISDVRSAALGRIQQRSLANAGPAWDAGLCHADARVLEAGPRIIRPRHMPRHARAVVQLHRHIDRHTEGDARRDESFYLRNGQPVQSNGVRSNQHEKNCVQRECRCGADDECEARQCNQSGQPA
jgi:hypothetical protein